MAKLLLYTGKPLPGHHEYGVVKGGTYEIYIFKEIAPPEAMAEAYAAKTHYQLLKAGFSVEVPPENMHLLPQEVKYALTKDPEMVMFGVFVGYKEGSEPEDLDPMDYLPD